VTVFDRLRRKAPAPEFTVQLHRVKWADGQHRELESLNSWEPVKVQGLQAARDQARRLGDQNRWGDADSWPHVQITDADGRPVAIMVGL
jgi:hypothetical protein